MQSGSKKKIKIYFPRENSSGWLGGINYFKNILSISDIQKLLGPLAQKYFPGEGSIDLTALYEEIMKLEVEQIEPLAKDVTRKFSLANDSFQDISEEEKEFLHKFAFICMLSFDVYVKNHIPNIYLKLKTYFHFSYYVHIIMFLLLQKAYSL